jgi:hypothetical protein
MLRSGISFQQFSDLAKAAFVEEAYAQIDVSVRRGNDSRVAAKTGISRKEIRRLRDSKSGASREELSTVDRAYGAAARALHQWHYDPNYRDRGGQPRDLLFDGEEFSFVSLVRESGGDIPAGAIRTELLQAGALMELKDGRLKVTKKFYIPAGLDDKTISTIYTILFPVSAGMAHNLNPNRSSQGFIQRFAFADTLQPAQLEDFRAWARHRAAAFVEEVDQWFANESKSAGWTSGSVSAPLNHAGLGVFYYEGPKAGQLDE